MSFFQKWIDAWSVRNRALIRIADALERIAPPIEEAVELKPEEAVTYVDEHADAIREIAEEQDRMRKYLDEHPEEAETLREGYGEGDVLG